MLFFSNLAFLFYFIELILDLWYLFFHLLDLSIETCVCFTKFSCCVFQFYHVTMFFPMLVILIIITSNLFSRFLVFLHWVRTYSFSLEKFVITHFLKPASVNSSHSFSIQFCSLAGEVLWSLEGEEAFWLLVNQCFSDGSFPSSWIYLPLVFEVGDFWMGFLSGYPFCWCWCYCFLFVSFPSNRLLCCGSAGVCWRFTPHPACLGITYRGCRTAKVAACSFLW